MRYARNAVRQKYAIVAEAVAAARAEAGRQRQAGGRRAASGVPRQQNAARKAPRVIGTRALLRERRAGRRQYAA